MEVPEPRRHVRAGLHKKKDGPCHGTHVSHRGHRLIVFFQQGGHIPPIAHFPTASGATTCAWCPSRAAWRPKNYLLCAWHIAVFLGLQSLLCSRCTLGCLWAWPLPLHLLAVHSAMCYGNAMHAVHTQCEVLDVGKYSNPSFGPVSQVIGSLPGFLWLLKHLGCGIFELSTTSP